MRHRRDPHPFQRPKTAVTAAIEAAEAGRPAHLTEDAAGAVTGSDGQEVSPLERLLLDMVAEVRSNLRWRSPVPDLDGSYLFDHYQRAAVRMQTLCAMYEVLTQRVGAEGLHLAVAVAAETATPEQLTYISRWLNEEAPVLPQERQVRDWPVTTFSPDEDDALARLRDRSPQLDDVTFTDAPRTSIGDVLPGFDPEQAAAALAALDEIVAIAKTVGGTRLLIGPKRIVALAGSGVVKMRRDHTPATKAAYRVLRTRYGKRLRISAGEIRALEDYEQEELEGLAIKL